jgi:hypothetical protein
VVAQTAKTVKVEVNGRADLDSLRRMCFLLGNMRENTPTTNYEQAQEILAKFQKEQDEETDLAVRIVNSAIAEIEKTAGNSAVRLSNDFGGAYHFILEPLNMIVCKGLIGRFIT